MDPSEGSLATVGQESMGFLLGNFPASTRGKLITHDTPSAKSGSAKTQTGKSPSDRKRSRHSASAQADKPDTTLIIWDPETFLYHIVTSADRSGREFPLEHKFLPGSEAAWEQFREEAAAILPSLKKICIDPDSYVEVSDAQYRTLDEQRATYATTTQLAPVLLRIANSVGGELVQYQSDLLFTDTAPDSPLDCPNAAYTAHIKNMEARKALLPLTVGKTTTRLNNFPQHDELLPYAPRRRETPADLELIRYHPIKTGNTTWHWKEEVLNYVGFEAMTPQQMSEAVQDYAKTVREGQLEPRRQVICLARPEDMTKADQATWLRDTQALVTAELDPAMRARKKKVQLMYTGDE